MELPPLECGAFMKERRNMIWLIGLLIRPGVPLASVAIEYILYPPDTDKNNHFESLVTDWEGITFSILGVPKQDKPSWRPYIRASGLTIANGVPTLVGDGQVKQFPVNLPTLFSLEFRSGHICYSYPDIATMLNKVQYGLSMRLVHGNWRPTPRELEQTFLNRHHINQEENLDDQRLDER